MRKEILALMAICLVLTFSAASARAEAVSTSQAWIDWTSLTITGNITWTDKGSESYAWAEDATDWDEDFDSAPGWVDTSAFASIVGSAFHAYGDAYTDADYLYEEVYAIANGATTMWADANAYACRWGDFIADSSGWVTFSADYEFSQSLRTDYVGEWAHGFAKAELWLLDLYMFVVDDDTAELENFAPNGQSITDGDAGTLTVSLWFEEGFVGSFVAGVENKADVEIPEPTTIALLGFGALSLLRRKRR